MGKSFKKVCECDAYDFPHRPNSGRCDGESQYRHAAQPVRHDKRLSPDEILDDPRRGQAAGLNAKIRRPQ